MRSRLAKIAYGFGNMGPPILFHAIGAYLLYFYIDIVRLDIRLVNLAFAISYGIWNAINDPLVGWLSDRTRTRWGRRKPYILFGTPIMLLFFFLVWSPPVGGKPLVISYNLEIFFYFAIVIALFDLFFTAVGVPYVSLFPEMFEDLKERTEVSAYRQVAAMIGCILGFGVTPIIAKSLAETFGTLGGWTGAAVIIGLIGSIAFWVSLLGSRERKEFSMAGTLPLIAAFKTTFTNFSFLTFVSAALMIAYIWSWLSAMVPFFTKYIIGATEAEMGYLFLAMFLTSVVFYPLWRAIALRLGSKRTLTIAVALFVIFVSPVLVVVNLAQALAMFLLLGIANSGVTLVREILLSDVIDEDELRTGVRREGNYFGVMAFIERFALVFVGGSTSLVLSTSGYVPDLVPQAPSTVLGMRIGIFVFPILALMLFLLAMRYYPLNKERVSELRGKLERLHREKAEQLGAAPGE